MYIQIEDPETPGKRLYADLTIMTETFEDTPQRSLASMLMT